MRKNRMYKLIPCLLAILILNGCSGGTSTARQSTDAQYKESGNEVGLTTNEEYENIALTPTPAHTSGKSENTETINISTPETLTDEKLVYTCNINLETTEYNKTVNALREQIKNFNAIIENESENDDEYDWYYANKTRTSGTKSMNITIRVPSKDYTTFISAIGTLGKVRSKSQNVQNISKSYYDTETKIESLEIELNRLKDMLQQAKTIEEMLQIEDRMTQVEYELSASKSNLSDMDLDVAYSTIYINIREVLVYTPDQEPVITFPERVKYALSDSWDVFVKGCQGFVIIVIYLLPLLIIVGVILLIIFILNKKHPEWKEKRHLKKCQKAYEKNQARMMHNQNFATQYAYRQQQPQAYSQQTQSIPTQEKQNQQENELQKEESI